jgi:hypothetical protein
MSPVTTQWLLENRARLMSVAVKPEFGLSRISEGTASVIWRSSMAPAPVSAPRSMLHSNTVRLNNELLRQLEKCKPAISSGCNSCANRHHATERCEPSRVQDSAIHRLEVGRMRCRPRTGTLTRVPCLMGHIRLREDIPRGCSHRTSKRFASFRLLLVGTIQSWRSLGCPFKRISMECYHV